MGRHRRRCVPCTDVYRTGRGLCSRPRSPAARPRPRTYGTSRGLRGRPSAAGQEWQRRQHGGNGSGLVGACAAGQGARPSVYIEDCRGLAEVCAADVSRCLAFSSKKLSWLVFLGCQPLVFRSFLAVSCPRRGRSRGNQCSQPCKSCVLHDRRSRLGRSRAS